MSQCALHCPLQQKIAMGNRSDLMTIINLSKEVGLTQNDCAEMRMSFEPVSSELALKSLNTKLVH